MLPTQAIEVIHLGKSYPGIKALDDLSFTVSKGSIHGLLGPNGAGKSTTLKIIAGLMKSHEGEVRLNGSFAYLPEIPPLYTDMAVEKFLLFVTEIYAVAKNQRQERVQESLEQVRILNLKDRLIAHLSKGQKQRVALASVLLQKPDILILDEPTVGLDPASIVEIRDLIRELKKKHTILLSTHQLGEVQMICDSISIIDHGKLILSGPLAEVQKNFKQEQAWRAELGNFSEEKKNFFQALPFVSRLTVEKRNQRFIVTFYLQDKQNARAQLTQHLVEQNCELYSFQEESLNLEEIFLKSTSVANITKEGVRS